MSLKTKLLNSISNYTTIDDLYEVGMPHKHETIARKLRELTHEGKIIPVKNKGSIIAYMKIYKAKLTNPHRKPEKLTTGQKSANKDDLNDKLKSILQSIKPSWDNIEKIKEIQEAIKAKYDTTKTNIINKYKTL
jgi:hypothetical protein